MTLDQIAALTDRTVRMTFTDGAIVVATIVSVDPDVADDHVIYDISAVDRTGSHFTNHGVGKACMASAEEIVSAVLV